MAYLPDLTAPRSWEPEAPQRRSRVFGVIVALFFALLLCAASAFATAVYLDGVHVDAQVALNDEPTAGGPGRRGRRAPTIPGRRADAAWVAGRKAGYKKGVAAGKLQSEKARKQAYNEGPGRGQEGGRGGRHEGGLPAGLAGRRGPLRAGLGRGQPGAPPGTGAVNAPDANSPTP